MVTHGLGFPKFLKFIYFLSKISLLEFSFLFPNKILNLIHNFFVNFFMWSFDFLNFKNNFSQAWINSAISLSNHSCILFLILISLLGAILLTTLINLLRKSMYAASTQEKLGEIIIWEIGFLQFFDKHIKQYLRDLRNTLLCLLKFASATFYQILVFLTSNIPSKTIKNVFIPSKKVFLFSRYSNFCNFFVSFPHFPDSKGHMEIE